MATPKYYSDEKNTQIVLALLKANGIRKVIANPGTANVAFVGSVQNDTWFEVFNGIDERHSAYMAVGMASECGEPVVLSCTGATASRNYLPAMTEAFYRKLPILAVTTSHHLNNVGNLWPQMIDRSALPHDVVRYSIHCPVPHTNIEEDDCILNVNKAILELSRAGGGPVHINLETEKTFSFGTRELPACRVIRRITPFETNWPDIAEYRNIVVWVGCHKRFSTAEIVALSTFAKRKNAIVLVDKTSSSYSGAYRVDGALLCSQHGIKNNLKFKSLAPDLVIQIGEISGDYPSKGFLGQAKDVWRVSEDGEARDLFRKLNYVFEMPEKVFFTHYSDEQGECVNGDVYWNKWVNALADLRSNIPEVPFGNIWIAQHLSQKLPAGTELHLGILNSLRSWNLVDLPVGVTSSCNVGGFGIDGCMSTMIGASLVRPEKLFFGVFGDLAFFYDLNALGNRHIGRNVRILLVNNGCGVEFALSANPASRFGGRVFDYIAAGGHFHNETRTLVRHFSEDLGFKYITASTKEEFLQRVNDFISPDCDKPILFECFTSPGDESAALEAMCNIVLEQSGGVESMKNFARKIMPVQVRNVIKNFVK